MTVGCGATAAATAATAGAELAVPEAKGDAGTAFVVAPPVAAMGTVLRMDSRSSKAGFRQD
jgi:mannose/fructose/N-acetylgalactosamine-specific phosphotransferase system component IIC